MRRNWIANIIAALNQDCVVQASNACAAEDDIDLELDAGCREFCAEVDYDDHLATLRVAPEIIDGEKQVDVRVDRPIEEDIPVIVISDSFRLAALCALPAICRYGLNFPDAYQARNALMTLYRS